MCTAPFTRLPYYHTLKFLLPAWGFAGIAQLAHLRRGPITYQFHAADFLDVELDQLDKRIGVHPGMAARLDAKLALAADAVRRLARHRRVVPLAEAVASQFPDAPAAAAAPLLE